MAGGWGNTLMRNETEFLVLDGMLVRDSRLATRKYDANAISRMVGIASVLMTVFHPGFFFEPMRKFKKNDPVQDPVVNQP